LSHQSHKLSCSTSPTSSLKLVSDLSESPCNLNEHELFSIYFVLYDTHSILIKSKMHRIQLAYMGLFSKPPNKHLKRAMKELEKYEAKTSTDVTVVVEERNQKSGRSKIQCPKCNTPRLMDLGATTDSCTCDFHVTFPD